jgi:hypothetical protein
MSMQATPARFVEAILRLLFLFFISYGMLYFSYKYYNPNSGGVDFFEYYRMYLHPLDLSAADQPFVFRQLSAIATHLVYIAGIYYPNDIWFHEAGIDQRVFFAALFSNFIFLVLSAWLAGSIAQEQLAARSFIPAALAGLICLLSFHSQVSVITGNTEGLSWFLIALTFLLYLKRRALPLAIVLALAVLQRELILVVFAAIAGLALLLQDEKKFNGFVLFWSLTCFIVHAAVRKFALTSPDMYGQLDPGTLAANLVNFHPTKEFLFQAIISQNLLILYIASSLLLAIKAKEWSVWPAILLGAVLTIAIVTILSIDNANTTNLGRYASLLSPIFASGIAAALARLDALA